MSLFHRLLLIIFGVGLTPIIPTGVLLFYYQSVAKSNTLDLHVSVSRMASAAVKQNMETLTSRLAFAEILEKAPVAGKNQAETVIKQAMSANPDFLLVAILDEGGRELLKVGGSAMLRRYGVLDRSRDPVFLNSKQTGKVVLSDFDSVGGLPAGTLVFPLKDGRYVFMVVSFSGLWSHLKDQKIGSTGRIFLADPQGRILRFEGDAAPSVDPDFLREMFSLKKERSDFIPARDAVFAGAFSAVPGLNLFVVTLQLRDEAFWVIKLTTSLIIFFLLAIATASYFAALSASRRLIGPITELLEGAKRVGAENFSVPVDERAGPGEFEVLLKAFNEMMGEVKKYHGLHLDQILQEKEKVDLLLKLMHDGIILADLKGEVIYANRKALDAMGFGEEKKEGFSVSAPELKGRLREAVDAITTKIRESDTIELGKAGKRFFKVSVRIFPAGKEAPGMFMALRDVTLEHELDAMKDDFFHSVAHDLRAPLLGMQGYLKLLENSCSSAPKALDYISAMRRSGDKLFVLVQDILDMARMEAGQLKPIQADVDFRELFEKVSESFAPLASEKRIELSLCLPENAGSFRADNRLIERALQNLVSNAIKFAPEGGKVTVGCLEKGGNIEISVSDNGPGIPAGKAQVIFEKFRRIDMEGAAREIPEGEQLNAGFGLGLAICSKIAELHSGKIWVESEPGKGSRFVIRIPGTFLK